jgi:hypothetical protein
LENLETELLVPTVKVVLDSWVVVQEAQEVQQTKVLESKLQETQVETQQKMWMTQ